MGFSNKEVISNFNESGFNRMTKIKPDLVGWGMYGSWGNGCGMYTSLLKNVAIRGVRYHDGWEEIEMGSLKVSFYVLN